jgi:WD40 repeat protein
MLMTSAIRLHRTLAILLTVMTRSGAGEEPLTRVQIVRAGKAATALVEVSAARGQGYGSAFCVHPAGWFLTNAHVAAGDLTLVLNPSLKTEKSYPARVVRRDEEADLALLKVEAVTGLPSLTLGSDEGLVELMEVIGFGYPLSTIAGREISVSVGRITALRHKEGHLERIQLDGALAKGNSGGPVLDKDGKVIGVVVSGIVAAGMNFAIPVSVVSRFLARPEVQFNPPRLSPSNMHKATTFEARVATLLPSTSPLTVELILKAGKGPERTLRMDAQGDRYRVTAVPIPEPTGPWTLRLAARFENATLDAPTTERPFTIGGREVKLSAARSIFPGSPARVVLRRGETITGDLVGLEAVPARLSGQTMSVDLASAKEVKVSPSGEADRVQCSLVVRQREEEIYRQSRGLSVGDPVKIVEIARFRGHNLNCPSLVVSADGQRILSGSQDGSMIHWDRETGRMIRRFTEQLLGLIESVAISPDGRRGLSGGRDTILRLWDLESSNLLREFRGHTEPIWSVAFAPDGRLAYSTSGGNERQQDGRDSAIRVWDIETGREVRRLEGHRGLVWSVAVSPDGRRVLSGGNDAAPILWDAETGAEIRRFRTNRVGSVAFLPDGRRAVTGGELTIHLLDLETGQELHCFRGHRDGVTGVAVSPDGRWLLSSSYGARELLLWDIEARKLIHRLHLGDLNPNRGAFTPDGLHAFWAGWDGVVRLYELQPDESGTSENGGPVYLCDLTETDSLVGHGALGKNGDLGYEPGDGDRRIIVKGVLAKKGLPMHSREQRFGCSFARYQLDGKYTSFHSVVAANDSVRVASGGMAVSPMTFSVVGDGRELWKSQPLQRPGESQPCIVDVTGVQQLEVRVWCDNRGAGAAHAVWVDPYVQ